MKFALVNGVKIEATKGVKGLCRYCDSELISRCGEERVNHWAHKGSRNCDPWWENETEWHRSWKNNFPKEWQEIIHADEKSGERHIADVQTDSDWVIEFQHSHIKPEERRSRIAFYPKLVWVLDGTRRKRDKPNFHRILDEFAIRSDDVRFKAIIGPDDCKLIKEWHESNALVFLDFQDYDDTKQPILWFLFPKIAENEAHLWPIPRDHFIELHNNNTFDELVEKTISPFIKKLIYKEKMKNEMEESRQRERKARMGKLKGSDTNGTDIRISAFNIMIYIVSQILLMDNFPNWIFRRYLRLDRLMILRNWHKEIERIPNNGSSRNYFHQKMLRLCQCHSGQTPFC